MFFFTSLPEAFRRRWRFYLALAASWLVVAVTVLISPRAHSVGFSSGVDPWTYLLNQSLMITRYLALTIWPRGLVVVYGFARPLTLIDVLPQFLFIATLFALTVAAFRYRPKLGFLGAWFFLTLGATSSVVPIATEAGAERRMYLPLAALVVLAVSLIAWLSDQITRTRFARASRTAVPGPPGVAVTIVCAAVWAAVAGLFAADTVARNREYSSALQLARMSVDRRPNGHGRHVLATELLKAGRHDEAIAVLREAVRDDSRSHYTLGLTLFQDGKFAEAREQLFEFVRLEPLLLEAVNARALIGRTLVGEGKLDSAAEQFSMAQAMQPAFPDAHLGLGEVRFAQQRYADAIVQYQAYLSTNATDDGVWINLGVSYLRTGHIDDAIAAFERATEVNPRSGSAQRNLAATLLQKGDIDAAVRHAREAVALRPSDPLSHDLLGVALVANRTVADAIAEFHQALQLNPTDAEAQAHLQQALALQGSERRR